MLTYHRICFGMMNPYIIMSVTMYVIVYVIVYIIVYVIVYVIVYGTVYSIIIIPFFIDHSQGCMYVRSSQRRK